MGTCGRIWSAQAREVVMEDALFDAMVDLNEQEALRLVEERVGSGKDPVSIVGVCRGAMAEVGKRYARKEYFLSQLVYAGEIFKQIMKILEPWMKAAGEEDRKLGKVVLGTARGDVHDIGKNIAAAILRGNGFEVHDLGTDVPAERFVEKLRETGAWILGMSCLISVAWQSMKDTVEAVREAGLRDRVKIIVGGGLVDEQVARYVNADAYAGDVVHGVEICKRWVKP